MKLKTLTKTVYYAISFSFVFALLITGFNFVYENTQYQIEFTILYFIFMIGFGILLRSIVDYYINLNVQVLRYQIYQNFKNFLEDVEEQKNLEEEKGEENVD